MERKLTRIWGVRLSLGHAGEADLLKALARGLAVRIEAFGPIHIVRRSLDARQKKRALFWVFTLDVAIDARPGRLPSGWRLGEPPEPLPSPQSTSTLRRLPIVVVGTGPAGLFAALSLAEAGAKVAVLEQGAPLSERVAAVGALWREGLLSSEANVQFGEGGAGTFSDGKLVTRVRDPKVRIVLEEFVRRGAPERILEEAHPHVGTDGIRKVVTGMREYLTSIGVSFEFHTRVTGIARASSARSGASGASGGWQVETTAGPVEAQALFLAVGHSSRALFRSLAKFGVPFQSKGFAVGCRVEHSQEWVDRCQYGRFAGHVELPAAEYFLRWTDGATGRGVYSFCMCPGGMVVNSASEPGQLVTNGMSMSHRASGLANAGIVVTVPPGEFGDDPLAALVFQESLEQRAFLLGGGAYHAPAQRIASFLEGRADESLPRLSYRPGTRPVDLGGFFPEAIEGALKRAFKRFDKLLPGFIEQGTMLVPETRTSSPLQVRRADDLSVEGFPGLYLVGEGAGWSGGITSSAVDALRCAEALVARAR